MNTWGRKGKFVLTNIDVRQGVFLKHADLLCKTPWGIWRNSRVKKTRIQNSLHKCHGCITYWFITPLGESWVHSPWFTSFTPSFWVWSLWNLHEGMKLHRNILWINDLRTRDTCEGWFYLIQNIVIQSEAKDLGNIKKWMYTRSFALNDNVVPTSK